MSKLRIVDRGLADQVRAFAEASVDGRGNQVCLAVQTAVLGFPCEDETQRAEVFDGVARALGALMARERVDAPAQLATAVATAALVYRDEAAEALGAVAAGGRA